MGWQPFDNGRTVGHTGSEDGTIVYDDEHDRGARITLERNCGNVPVAVTCGIYGWFFHTRFLNSEAEAQFDQMKSGLAAILEIIPHVGDSDGDAKLPLVSDAIQEFVNRFR